MNILKNKIRLWIEYALILAVVALLGFAATSVIRGLRLENKVTALQGDLAAEKNKVAEISEANKTLGNTINTIKLLREADGLVVSGLQSDIEKFKLRDDSVSARIAFLERNDAQIASWLRAGSGSSTTQLCVLDNTCPGGGSENRVPETQQRTSPAVRGTGRKTKR